MQRLAQLLKQIARPSSCQLPFFNETHISEFIPYTSILNSIPRWFETCANVPCLYRRFTKFCESFCSKSLSYCRDVQISCFSSPGSCWNGRIQAAQRKKSSAFARAPMRQSGVLDRSYILSSLMSTCVRVCEGHRSLAIEPQVRVPAGACTHSYKESPDGHT